MSGTAVSSIVTAPVAMPRRGHLTKKEMHMRNASICLALAAALSMPGIAIAAEEGAPAAASKRHWLGKAEVEAKVAAAGYTVKRTRNGVGRYEVRAKGKDGKTITLFVSPWTGEIIGQDTKWGGR